MSETIIVPTKLRVSSTVKVKGKPETTDSTEEVIEVTKFATTPAIVRVSIPLKLSMDYQSLGIEIGLDKPCYAEETDKAFDEAYATVMAKVKAKIPEIQKALSSITGRKVLAE